MRILEHCILCPRKCGVNRNINAGFCGASSEIVAAKAYLHQWEEPCISFENGAGTIFFSGCNMHCCYCQNNYISNEHFGKEISIRQLADIMLNLQISGADNIELVTPTHFVPQIIKALDIAKSKLNIPVIYNTGGYECIETIKMLDGYIDIYMPDLKYFSSETSQKYSKASDYFKYASQAVNAMTEQAGVLRYNNGKLLKGTIIRHLVLPGQRHDSMKILDWICDNLDAEKYIVSLMNQYTPFDFIPENCSELRRKVTKMEYNSVVSYAEKHGIKGYTQEASSADNSYVPDFDLIGL